MKRTAFITWGFAFVLAKVINSKLRQLTSWPVFKVDPDYKFCVKEGLLFTVTNHKSGKELTHI